MTAARIFRLLGRAHNRRADAVPERVRAEVRRMRETFEVRESLPPHVPRAWCEDCAGVVVLLDSGTCPCGSRSVVPHGARRAA